MLNYLLIVLKQYAPTNYSMKVIVISFCTVALKSEAQNVRHLQPTPGHADGDITFDDKIDDKGFYVCNAGEIFQYYSLSLTNNAECKRWAQKQILRLKPSSTLDASGYLSIRFIVNCEGKADRFRILEVPPFAWSTINGLHCRPQHARLPVFPTFRPSLQQ